MLAPLARDFLPYLAPAFVTGHGVHLRAGARRATTELRAGRDVPNRVGRDATNLG